MQALYYTAQALELQALLRLDGPADLPPSPALLQATETHAAILDTLIAHFAPGLAASADDCLDADLPVPRPPGRQRLHRAQ